MREIFLQFLVDKESILLGLNSGLCFHLMSASFCGWNKFKFLICDTYTLSTKWYIWNSKHSFSYQAKQQKTTCFWISNAAVDENFEISSHRSSMERWWRNKSLDQQISPPGSVENALFKRGYTSLPSFCSGEEYSSSQVCVSWEASEIEPIMFVLCINIWKKLCYAHESISL